MVQPIARDLIDLQAQRFREEFAALLPSGGDGTDVHVNTWFTVIQELEVKVFFLLNFGILNAQGINHPEQLAQWGKEKAAERRQRFRAMGGADKVEASEDEFNRICKLAADVFKTPKDG
ncbi:MAG: hypothetical protein OEU92_06035 [Alphaproteobacteria bacterium]|nr:hypothetical protein [Alphaproteobacteria bacterium]